LHPEKRLTHSHLTLPSHAEDGVTYHALHPFERAREGITHNQVSDRVHEEKSIQCVERYISQWPDTRRRIVLDTKRPGGWRYLTDVMTGKDVAEWEGIWEDSRGNVIF